MLNAALFTAQIRYCAAGATCQLVYEEATAAIEDFPMAAVLEKLLERIGTESNVHVQCRLIDCVDRFADNDANAKTQTEKLDATVLTLSAAARQASTLEVQHRAISALAVL